MVNKFFNCKFHLRFVFNPLIRFKARRFRASGINNRGVNRGGKDVRIPSLRKTPIIVSLTSYEERFDDLVISLYSLLNQSLKPDRIILWLSDEYEGIFNLPYEIRRYIKNGLEIRFVKDLRSYTKVVYALKEFPDSIIVTADDDIYYPKDWLEKLYYSYIAHSEDIQVHRAHRIKVEDGKIAPYESWEKHVKEEGASYKNFLTGVGGVLYPPNCFSKEVLRESVFLRCAPYADDIWLWVMALVHKRKIRVVKNHINTLTCTDFWGQIFKSKKTLYALNSKGENDRQLENLMKFYKQNVISRLS